jgi:hypothetical protein
MYRFIYVPAPHTGEVISDVLHDVLHDWQLEKKVSTVIVLGFGVPHQKDMNVLKGQ